MENNKWLDIAVDMAELVKEKNEAYGDAVGCSDKYLRLLYPDGVKPEQYRDMLMLVRDFDKNMRIAHRKEAFGESPWRDKVGYALLAVEMDEREKIQEPGDLLEHERDTCKHEDKHSYEEPCDSCDERDNWEPKEPEKSCDNCLEYWGESIDKCGLASRLTKKCKSGDFMYWKPKEAE